METCFFRGVFGGQMAWKPFCNCAFPQNFYTKESGETLLFCAVFFLNMLRLLLVTAIFTITLSERFFLKRNIADTITIYVTCQINEKLNEMFFTSSKNVLNNSWLTDVLNSGYLEFFKPNTINLPSFSFFTVNPHATHMRNFSSAAKSRSLCGTFSIVWNRKLNYFLRFV